MQIVITSSHIQDVKAQSILKSLTCSMYDASLKSVFSFRLVT